MSEDRPVYKTPRQRETPVEQPAEAVARQPYVMPKDRAVAIRYAIGIDPDLKGFGFGVYDRQDRRLIELSSLDFYDLVRRVQVAYPKGQCEIYLENSWKSKGLYAKMRHIKAPKKYAHLQNNPEALEAYSHNVRGKKMYDVGQNHASGKQMAGFLTKWGYTVHLPPPADEKWSADTLKQITGFTTKNQDQIDAARLCYGR